MRKQRILITPRSLTEKGHPALHPLEAAGYELVFASAGKQPDEAELLEKLPGCVGYLAGVEQISARVLEAATGLRVISRNGVGIDNIGLDAVQRLGIQILRAEGANSRGVAELTFALIFALARMVPYSDGKMKRGEWTRRLGIELRGRTLGIIGCGRIGREVACMGVALGMRVLGYEPLGASFFTPALEFHYCGFEELLTGSDVITLHCPAHADAIPVIDASAISLMKPGVLLINTARASLLEEPALLSALEQGKLGGLALDVYEWEPPGNFDLINQERVIAMPHVGGYTQESVDRAVECAVENLIHFLSTKGAMD